MPKRDTDSLSKGSDPNKIEQEQTLVIPIETSVLNTIAGDADLFEKAHLLQARAAEFGFDWPTVEPVFGKLEEEIAELKTEISQASQAGAVTDYHRMRVQDELGDVLFCCVNLARFMGVDAAKALQGTSEKFGRRFRYIEQIALAQGKQLSDMTLGELDQLWDAAKVEGL